MVISKCKQKKFEGDLKIKLCSKRLYAIEILNLWVRRLIQIFVGNIMFMIFSLN